MVSRVIDVEACIDTVPFHDRTLLHIPLSIECSLASTGHVTMNTVHKALRKRVFGPPRGVPTVSP